MLKTRVITAIILASVVGVLLFKANALIWQGFVLLATAIAAWEWAGFANGLTTAQKIQYSLLVTLFTWFILPLLNFSGLALLTALSALWMLFAVIRYQKTQGQVLLTSRALILLLGLVSIFLFAKVLIDFREVFSPLLLLFSMFVVWSIDTGAYFSGKKFGKHKLAVYVSPGKTWEGVVGGFLLSFVVAWLGLQWLTPQLQISDILMALAMAAIALFSVVGDLYESLLKRQAAIKDSGVIFPGHGGMLDRVDSLMIAMPMFYLLWFWVQA